MFATAVLGLDASESSDRALAYAAALARQNGTKLHAVHVIELAVGRGAGPVHLDETERKEKISAQVAELRSAGLEVELELRPAIAGGPAHVLVETADRLGADVIITGTRGHTAVAGIIVGSVTQRLLHIAHCPLLVIPAVAQEIASEPVRESAALATG
jgi:nucleotide-binding universal stress UspA family protein